MPIAVTIKKFKFWHDVLPHVTKRKKVLVKNEYSGHTLGVDADSLVWEFANNMDEVIRAIGNRLSYYEPTKLMRTFERTHERFLLQNITPIYVFGGEENPVARRFQGRDQAYSNMHRFYTVHGIGSSGIGSAEDEDMEHHLNRPKLREYNMAASQIRRMRDVDPKVIRFMANWMQSLGMEVIGAPFEPHWQLVELERVGRTSGSISSHMNVVIAGGQNVMVNPNYRENMRCSVYRRDKDLCSHHWTYDFTKYIDYLPEFAALYGTLYNVRVSGLTLKYIYKKKFPPLVEAARNGEDYWSQLTNANEKFTLQYQRACQQFRYGPVYRDHGGDHSSVEPLNPLPDGSTWEELLGYDPIQTLTVDPDDYKRAANFDGRTFVDETSLSPWYNGLFPKLRDSIEHEAMEDEDEDDEPPPNYLEMLRKERLRVPRPAPKVKEPEILGW
jgi:XPG N-terminal domain